MATKRTFIGKAERNMMRELIGAKPLVTMREQDTQVKWDAMAYLHAAGISTSVARKLGFYVS